MSQAKQYQPTPELQKLLDKLTPQVLQLTNLSSQPLRLKSFSQVENDPNSFVFYIEAKEKGN